MIDQEQEARARILAAAAEIINEAPNIEKITVRQIAERAKVGIGLINYHFNSKDNLLTLAIGTSMSKITTDYYKNELFLKLSPRQKIKTILKLLCEGIISKEKRITFMLTREILHGDMQAPLAIIPVLKELYGDTREEVELRILALQILHPIQVAALSPEAFRLYSGMDLYEKEDQNKYIDMLLDNLIS